MSRPRWILSLILLLGLVLGADYFFLHVLFPLKKDALEREWTRQVDESLQEQPQFENPTSPPPADDENSNSETPDQGQNSRASDPFDFQAELRQCLDARADDTTPEKFVERLSRELAVKEQATQIENWHIQLADGREQRVMRIPSDRENAKGKKEVRLFDVDAEGLPVPLPLDEAEAFDPRPDYVDSLISQGQLTYHQLRESRVLTDGTSLSVEWVNGQVRELQVFAAQKTFACREGNCRCL